MHEVIKTEVRGPAGLIQLSRPEKYNALTRAMLEEIGDAVEAFGDDDGVRAIVITGTNDFFSTGADLQEAVTIDNPAASMRYHRIWRRLDRALEQVPKPVLAAIGGYCVTGGLELAMACDIRVAAENAQFAVTSARIGSVAGMGATQRLPRLIGDANAKDLLFSADYVDATTALRMGLISRCVPFGQALTECLSMVDVYSARAPLSLAWHKMAVNSGRDVDLQSAMDLEASLSAQAFATADKREGMTAFLEKRAAVFHGR